MEESTFQREDRKYSSLWSSGYTSANWERLAKAGIKKIHFLKGTPSMIDFGFGKGAAMKFFEENGIEIKGVEISKYAVEEQLKKGKKVYHASLDNLEMFADKSFRMGFCNDVLEHIPEKLIIPSLDEMTRVCSDYLFLSVCPTLSNHLSQNGENLHLTVKPEIWWEQLFEKYGKVKRMKFLFSRSARYEIDLK